MVLPNSLVAFSVLYAPINPIVPLPAVIHRKNKSELEHSYLIKTADEGSVWSKVWMRHGKYLFSPLILAHLIEVVCNEVLVCCSRRKQSARLEVAQRSGSHWGNCRGVPLVLLAPQILLTDTWLINCGISANGAWPQLSLGMHQPVATPRGALNILKLNLPEQGRHFFHPHRSAVKGG